MSWFTEHAGLTWLAIALILGVVEIATLDFFFILLAGGAVAGAVSAFLGADWTVSTLVAVGVALLMLITLRPVLVARARRTPHRASGAAALVGRSAQVLEPVSDSAGLVKLAGETWTARTEQGLTIGVGDPVTVVRIDGATAVVAVPSEQTRTPTERG